MTICPNCQARNSDSGSFCVRCGASLERAVTAPDPGEHTDAMLVPPEAMAPALVNRAATALADGHVAAALADCRRAIALEPGNVEAHALLGMAYEQEGDLEAALEAYEAVLGLDPARAVERQKAALLRLRVEGQPPVPVERPRWQTVLLPLWERVTANPPLAAAITAFLVVFVVGTLVLLHNGRAAARQRQAIELVATGDAAFAVGNYNEAVRQYAAAYDLQPGDEAIRQRWDQAYRLCVQPPTTAAASGNIAALPKYIPSGGPNPFAPVRIGGQAGEAPPPIATPLPNMGLASPPSAYKSFTSPVTPAPTVPTPPATVTPTVSPGGRNTVRPGVEPISPAPAKQPVKGTPAAPANPETPSRLAKGGEITIWASEQAPSPPATNDSNNGSNERSSSADALRSRAEQLAHQGRNEEAISEYQRAASAYEDAARRDPAGAAVNSQAAASCRARIEVLRMSP